MPTVLFSIFFSGHCRKEFSRTDASNEHVSPVSAVTSKVHCADTEEAARIATRTAPENFEAIILA